MKLLVQKFGGTSVGSVERIRSVAARVASTLGSCSRIVVVVSAMSGETDRLVSLARAVSPSARGREVDALLATGEQVTAAMLCLALGANGVRARSFSGAQAGILTDDAYNKARILRIDRAAIDAALDAGEVAVVTGFQGVTMDGSTTTLGRGGSDTTAVAVAAALGADECHIYTDVDGVYTTDPRIVPEARRLDRITYEEMLELASLGAKVLQIRSVEFASKYRVRLRVLSSFEEGPGTLICCEEEIMEEAIIAGVAVNRNEAKLTLTGVPDEPGIAGAILGAVSDANIEVDMIVQNVGADGTTDFTFTVARGDYDAALAIVQEASGRLGARSVEGDSRICKVSLVGVGMRSHAGIASRMFRALAAEGINIRMISTSEIKISVVVDERWADRAVQTLHAAFALDAPARAG